MSPKLAPCMVKKDSKGDPAYSVTDTVEIPNKWLKKAITVAIVRGTLDIPDMALEREIINLGLLMWTEEMGLTITQVKASQNPDVIIAFMSSSQDSYFASDSSILAWSGYPQTSLQGQMHFNDDYRWSKDGAPIPAHKADPAHYPDPFDPTTFRTYNLNQTFRHEFGHILGEVHIEDCPDCVMYPYYNGKLELQPVEITRIVSKYGQNTKGLSWYKRIKAWLQYRTRHE